jgi:hypothetical protein
MSSLQCEAKLHQAAATHSSATDGCAALSLNCARLPMIIAAAAAAAGVEGSAKILLDAMRRIED